MAERKVKAPSSGIPHPELDFVRARVVKNLPRLDRVHEWIKNRRLGKKDSRRAFVIEFAGMPKAGKSGCIETIRQVLFERIENSRQRSRRAQKALPNLYSR